MRTAKERLEDRRRGAQLKALVCTLVVLVILMGGTLVAAWLSTPERVEAVGNCKPGEVKVKHRETGKCNCLPPQAVADPWEEDDKCGVAEIVTAAPKLSPVVNTVVSTIPPVNTAVVDPSAVPTSTELPYGVPTPTGATVKASATPLIGRFPTKAAGAVLPGITVTAPVTCDICLQERRQADALERIADAVTSILNWFTR